MPNLPESPGPVRSASRSDAEHGHYRRIVDAAGLEPGADLSPEAQAVLTWLAQAGEPAVSGIVEIVGAVRMVEAARRRSDHPVPADLPVNHAASCAFCGGLIVQTQNSPVWWHVVDPLLQTRSLSCPGSDTASVRPVPT